MSKGVAIMLMSHGNFAKAAIESAELIVGKQENYDTLSVFQVDQVDELREEMIRKVEELDTSKGLLILTDIVGGTPMNLAGALLSRPNTMACSGLSLPVLLEALMNRGASLDQLAEIIKSAHAEGMAIRTDKDMETEEEEDDLL